VLRDAQFGLDEVSSIAPALAFLAGDGRSYNPAAATTGPNNGLERHLGCLRCALSGGTDYKDVTLDYNLSDRSDVATTAKALAVISLLRSPRRS
jgi:hypothetical protein